MSFKPVTVTTVVESVVDWNPRRRGIAFFNNGSATVFVSQDETNVAADGFPVAPGVTILFSSDEHDEPEMALFAVADSGSQNCRVQESVGREGT